MHCQTLENGKPAASGRYGQLGIDFTLTGRFHLGYSTTVRDILYATLRQLSRERVNPLSFTSDATSRLINDEQSLIFGGSIIVRLSRDVGFAVRLERSRRRMCYDADFRFMDTRFVQNLVLWSRILFYYLDPSCCCSLGGLHCDTSTIAYQSCQGDHFTPVNTCRKFVNDSDSAADLVMF